jgi:hypothetical protein
MPKKGPSATPYVTEFMKKYVDREVTIADIYNWHVDTVGQPEFQKFHVRDALYRLEELGLVERAEPMEGDRTVFWQTTPLMVQG